jgi:hypothetical protein
MSQDTLERLKERRAIKLSTTEDTEGTDKSYERLKVNLRVPCVLRGGELCG